MRAGADRPRPFDYLDVLSYLKDYYAWRKSLGRDFSYEFWSQELEFRSRSYIRMMVMGKKKVSEKFTDAFSRASLETREEREHFFYLVQYSQARNQRDKKAFGAKLTQILRSLTEQSVLEPEEDFVSDPVLPRLYILLGFHDLDPTLANLAKLMDRSEAEIARLLEKLEALDLIEASSRAGDRPWRARHEQFKIPDHKGNLDLMKFHERSLRDAIDAFPAPRETRKYKSLICPLSPEELGELSEAVDEFITEKVARYNSARYQSRRLFQLNVNFHAVTRAADPG